MFIDLTKMSDDKLHERAATIQKHILSQARLGYAAPDLDRMLMEVYDELREREQARAFKRWQNSYPTEINSDPRGQPTGIRNKKEEAAQKAATEAKQPSRTRMAITRVKAPARSSKPQKD